MCFFETKNTYSHFFFGLSENFKRFQYFNFETDLLENENHFQKLEYRFLVESTKIENASFPYKIAISKANAMTNKMVAQNAPITKNGVLPVTTLFFWKIYFSLRTSYKELICCTSNSNAHVCTFCKCWSFIMRCFFSLSILNRKDWNPSTSSVICIKHFENKNVKKKIEGKPVLTLSWASLAARENSALSPTYSKLRKSQHLNKYISAYQY